MSNIELSLKSNIALINAHNLAGYKVNSKELEPMISRICRNFYSAYGEPLAIEAERLWLKTQDRDFVMSLLDIAYDIEMDWRDHHPLRSFVKTVTNPQSYEPIPFSQLLSMTVPIEREVQQGLAILSYKDFLKTPYWKSVRKATIQFYGGECQMMLNRDGYDRPIQCGKQTELQVHHKTYDHARGLEHRHYKHDLTVLCEHCHLRSHLDEPDHDVWKKISLK